MKSVAKYYLCLLAVFAYAHADFPYAPDFSLSSRVLQEPPALPQIYNIELPDSWNYYAMKEPPERNALLPEDTMIMEICVSGAQTPQYPSKEAFIQSCQEGGHGITHLILQPYQYWSAIDSLRSVRLMPASATMHNPMPDIAKVVIFYKSSTQPDSVFTSIELGDFGNENSSFLINGRAFQYNIDVMRVFYGLIAEINDTMYLPENPPQYPIYRVGVRKVHY